MPRPASHRAGAVLVALLAALTPPGCARGRGQITPTTTGTDLKAMPRGRMTPLPFPGSSLARSRHDSDPGTTVASGEIVDR